MQVSLLKGRFPEQFNRRQRMIQNKKKRLCRVILPVLIFLLVFSSTAAAASDFILYTVKEGDTLSSIAARYDTSIEQITRDNRITDISKMVGKVVQIAVSNTNQSGEKAGSSKSTTFMLDIRDADIRDVLSIFAVTMKKNIVYTESAMNVSLSIRDVSPMKALDLLMNITGLTYIEDGNLIMVGKNETIHQNFYSMLPITQFSLSYISPAEINKHIDKLGIPVQRVVLDSTEKYIWAQGTPEALTKMRELIQVLDKAENIDPETQEIKMGLQLIPIELTYIEADVFNKLVNQLEIPCKVIRIDVNPQTVWVEADESALIDLKTLAESVDIAENLVTEEVEEVVDTTRVEGKKMRNITASRLLPLIRSLGIPVEVISIDTSGYNIWMRGDQDSINLLNDLINRLDTEYARDDVNYFTFTLTHLKATTAAAKLDFIGLQDVRIFELDYPHFSNELLISCPTDRINDVKNVLRKLDVPGEKIRVVVDSSSSPSAEIRLEKRRDLVVTLTGLSKSSFHVSGNVSKGSDPYFVLWVEETPENIVLIKEAIKNIDSP